MLPNEPLTRRGMLKRMGAGLGMIGLAGLLADDARRAGATPAATNPLAPRPPHFAPGARRLIHLFMNGGPSQVDTFDPKPALERYHGQALPAGYLSTERGGARSLMRSPFRFQRHGQSGLEVSEIFPRVA